MNLTPKERERLTVFMTAELARRRKDRGVKLNHPEAVTYISDWVIEGGAACGIDSPAYSLNAG